MDFERYPGIHLNNDEATRVVRSVIGETPMSSDLFESLRRQMQLETLAKLEPIPAESEVK